MEALCSVPFAQKRRRRENTTSTNNKLWKSYLQRFKLDLKGRRKVGIIFATGTAQNELRYNKLSSSGNSKPQRKRQTISRQDIASLQDGEELYEAVGDDPAYFEVNFALEEVDVISLINFVLIAHLFCLHYQRLF